MKLLNIVVAICLIVAVSCKNYYLITTHKVNWYVAFQDCLSRGLQLATINSHSEHYDLEKLLNNEQSKHQLAWISATDLGEKHNYVWMSTGKPMSYAKWYTGEPNHWHNEQYCVMTWPERNKLALSDFQCWAAQYYICEDKINENNNLTFGMHELNIIIEDKNDE